MTTKTVNVSKISCGHCVMTIEREVGELDGVSSVEADHVSKEVTISWDPGTTDWTAIQSRMEDIGYPAGE
jgi:copper ion binding protein